MQENYETKDMAKSAKVKTKKEETTEKNTYFFSGSTEYQPETIEASSMDEAVEIYEKTKKKVND